MLAGTTVESMPSEAQRLSELLVDLGETQLDAQRAIGMVLRRALQVQQEDGRRRPRLTLLPELLPLRGAPKEKRRRTSEATIPTSPRQVLPIRAIKIYIKINYKRENRIYCISICWLRK